MTTILLVHTQTSVDPALVLAIEQAGCTVADATEPRYLLKRTIHKQPDAILCCAPRVEAALLDAIEAVQAEQPTPVLVFTEDPKMDSLERGLRAGVQSWQVQPPQPETLRHLIRQAQVRQQIEQELRTRVSELESRLEERKLVERAKGLLMRSGQVDEAGAFTLIRNAAMQSRQQIGSVSKFVIEAAVLAECLNRSGQLRMLSQRLVKLYAMQCSPTGPGPLQALQASARQLVDDNLAHLASALPGASLGELLTPIQDTWQSFKGLITEPAVAAKVPYADRLAEQMLAQAEALVLALESSSPSRTASIVNISGRQRMLSQRAAKLLVVERLSGATEPAATARALEATIQEFDAGMVQLQSAPLRNTQIAAGLERVQAHWTELLGERRQGELRTEATLNASEAVLLALEGLTSDYQHSLQVLIG